MDTESRINLQKYRQFSECSTEKIIEEVYNYITIKRYSNCTADMFLHAFANIYQTKDTHQVTHLCKNEDHYDLLVVNKVPETATANFDDPQVAEDEISENCHNFDTEWEEEFITVFIIYL